MPDVELKVFDPRRGTIYAPDFCPFTSTEDGGDAGWSVQVVQASVCQLCKKCTFYTDGVPAVYKDSSLEDAQTLVRQAILADRGLLALIMKQIRYLQTKDRFPLAVLISFAALKQAVDAYEPTVGMLALQKVLAQSSSIGVVSGVPLYFSDKLTKTLVQVVGEVLWTY
jgi:hypothetical protein